jgi:opacity protein-like surface antigen
MKKILLITTLLALLFPSVLSALNEKETSNAQTAQVIANKADIFLEASQHSIVIDTIPRGTTVTLFPSGKKNKKWLYISYLSKKRSSQVTGFIDRNRVEIVKSSPVETENPELAEEQSSKEERSSTDEMETQDGEKEREELRYLLRKMEKEKQEKQTEEDSEKRREQAEQTEQEEIPQEDQEIEPPVEKQAEEKQKAVEEEPIQTEAEDDDAGENEDSTQEQGEKDGEEKAKKETPVEEPQETEVVELPKVLTKVAVKVPRANIRLMPTTKSPVIHQVFSGVELKHMAKTANWHRVNLAPNKEGIVLSGYIHNNIVDEIFETVVPPDPEPEEIPETKPEIAEKETETEPEPVQEVPTLRTPSKGKYYWVGGGAGYTMPSESNFGKGLNIGATFGFGVMKHLAVELRVPYYQSDVSGTVGGLSSGRLSSLSLMLSVQGRYPIKNRYVPYIVAGGDYHLNKFSLNEEITNFWNDLGYSIQESVDHTFGLHFGVGLDVFLLQNIVLNLDVRYYTANLTGSRTLAHQISQETSSGAIDNMKLNSLQAGISVKLFLDHVRKK